MKKKNPIPTTLRNLMAAMALLVVMLACTGCSIDISGSLTGPKEIPLTESNLQASHSTLVVKGPADFEASKKVPPSVGMIEKQRSWQSQNDEMHVVAACVSYRSELMKKKGMTLMMSKESDSQVERINKMLKNVENMTVEETTWNGRAARKFEFDHTQKKDKIHSVMYMAQAGDSEMWLLTVEYRESKKTKMTDKAVQDIIDSAQIS